MKDECRREKNQLATGSDAFPFKSNLVPLFANPSSCSGGWLASIFFTEHLDNYLSFNIISIIRHQKSHRKTGCKSR